MLLSLWAQRSQKRPDLQRVEEGGRAGGSEGSLEGWLRRGDRVISSPLVVPPPRTPPCWIFRQRDWESCSEGWEETEETRLTQATSSGSTRQDFFCDLEGDGTRERESGRSC